MHNYSCFEQSCDKSVWSCGKSKLEEYFGPLSAKLGHLKLELYQHLKEAYLKPDGSKVCFSQLKSNNYWQFQGTKFELKKLDVSFKSLLNCMCDRLFHGKEPYLTHCLKKELGRMGRKDLRLNLGEEDVIIYTDFSKGFAFNSQYVY